MDVPMPVVCDHIVCGRYAFGVDVDHGDDREAVRMVKGVLNFVGGLVTGSHGEPGIHGYRGRDVELVAMPAELQVGNGAYPGSSTVQP